MQDTNPDCAILVFAKAPVAGSVKTRLIPLLGAEDAATLHQRLLSRTLAVARSATLGALELWCTPDISHPFLQAMAREHHTGLQRQHGDDLGARMAHAFAQRLRQYRRLICIGTDCPVLTARHLQAADSALRRGDDAVFVPAEDGGYALIGLGSPAPQLFDGIAWGESRVMAQTRERLRANHMRWCELETLWDIDRPEDYQRLQQSGLLDDATAST